MVVSVLLKMKIEMKNYAVSTPDYRVVKNIAY